MNKKDKKEISLDDLASMVQKGFIELKTELKTDINRVEGKVDKLEKKVDKLEVDVRLVKEDLAAVKSDTEEIKAELNKKVDRFEHKGLEYRMEKLEKKFA